METFLEWGLSRSREGHHAPPANQFPPSCRQHTVPRPCRARFYMRSMTDLNTPHHLCPHTSCQKARASVGVLEPQPSTVDQEPPATGLATKLSKPTFVCISVHQDQTLFLPEGLALCSPLCCSRLPCRGVIQFTPCPAVGQLLCPGHSSSRVVLGNGLVQS